MKIAFVSTLSKGYVLGFKVFLKSILINNPTINIPYVVFNEGDLDQDCYNEIKGIYDNVIFKDINFASYKDCKFKNLRNWNINPANRLEIFTLEEFDKIIFFDVDMLCLGDISYLLNVNCDFGGVKHPMHESIEMQKTFIYDKEVGFNGGLLIVSKKFLNQQTISGIKEIINSHTWFGNQSSLNIYFKDQITFLPEKYFQSTPFMTFENIKTSVIWHFAGNKKPWEGATFDGKSFEILKEKYNNHVLKCTSFPVLIKVQKEYEKYKALI
jgi:lipopolysaccharide biosynthesis glycosyltransferase